MRILKERQISACEAVFRLAHLNMKESSRKTVFLNTRKPEQRYNALQFNETGHASGYCNNIFNRYENRPDFHPMFDFENMSLIEFSMLFELNYRNQERDYDESVDYDTAEEGIGTRTLIRLKDNTSMRVRNRPAVVQVPFFMAANDPENYYYSFLLQYMPYRQERELIEDYDTAREAFLAR